LAEPYGDGLAGDEERGMQKSFSWVYGELEGSGAQVFYEPRDS
jgi:hypothetical protein